MGIADEIAAASTPKRPPCSVKVALAKLDEKIAAEFAAEIAGPAPGTAIAAVLSRHSELKIAPQTLQRHRKGECSCERR
jgi:hypothetical protein